MSLVSSSLRPFNVMMGLSSLSLMGGSFSMSFKFISDNYLSLVAGTGLTLTTQVMYIQTYYCPYLTLLLSGESKCYDICPQRYIANTTSLICMTCPYDCYQCSLSGTCTACSAAIDYRQLNSSSGRCVAMDGYYDDGINSTAQPCSSDCLHCINESICL